MSRNYNTHKCLKLPSSGATCDRRKMRKDVRDSCNSFIYLYLIYCNKGNAKIEYEDNRLSLNQSKPTADKNSIGFFINSIHKPTIKITILKSFRFRNKTTPSKSNKERPSFLVVIIISNENMCTTTKQMPSTFTKSQDERHSNVE